MKHDGNDLLRRQDCIETIEEITSSMSVCVNTDECHGMKRMQRQAVLEIANMPAAQPEIIRCKDCKFSHMTNDGKSCKYCDVFTDDYGQLMEMYFESSFYCGYAERRTD